MLWTRSQVKDKKISRCVRACVLAQNTVSRVDVKQNLSCTEFRATLPDGALSPEKKNVCPVRHAVPTAADRRLLGRCGPDLWSG